MDPRASPLLNSEATSGPWLQAAALVGGTFASEDLTCIAAGLLIHAGRLNGWVGVVGCFLGIFVSDLALWLTGRLVGRRVLAMAWLNRRLPAQRLHQFEQWFARRGGTALVAARFLPGTRLPLYVAAGVLGQRFRQFAPWTFAAALVWTPLLVLAVAVFGEALVAPLTLWFGHASIALLLAGMVLFIAIRVGTLACTPIGRAQFVARVSRLWRWEFWPTWLFYLPVLPWLAYLSVRYRGLFTWTAANPGIPQGGLVGESKYAILAQLPERWIVPSLLVPLGDMADRLQAVRQAVTANGWQFPLILKPDASQRGAGVKRVHDFVDVEKYLHQQPAAVVVQTYHPGPYEAGIFYYRMPGVSTGRIFSITDKHFPEVIGDGHSTLEQLIWRHSRYRMQARVFLARHEASKGDVLAEDERFRLAVAGNHCQGTKFRDGAHLITPEQEQRVDEIARHFCGFFIGRFDVRYRDTAQFMAGRDLAIVELNGATSESTNIYDPSWSLLRAYRTLYRQWALLYRIGNENRRRGHAPTAFMELVRLLFTYYRGRRIDPLAY